MSAQNTKALLPALTEYMDSVVLPSILATRAKSVNPPAQSYTAEGLQPEMIPSSNVTMAHWPGYAEEEQITLTLFLWRDLSRLYANSL